MKLKDWTRIQDLFHRAMALPEAQREAFVRRTCETEPTLRAELLSLLAASDSGAMLDQVIGEAALQVGAAGQRTPIGAYEIQSEIGRGGMGIVYLAERADGQFQKQVAIKVVRLSYSSEDLEARFRAERQILADLDHANIARLLDGGTLPSGQPYLVMEYVAGETLDEFCRTRNLPIIHRLPLFLQVCEAVAYAHRRGVIHRDLKPGNILVNAEGVVKLLDFGTAKLIQSNQAYRTLTNERRLTAAYASPEQILNQPVGPASDIYSLGVILYELIAGRHPFETDWGTPYAMERAICEREPPRPGHSVEDHGLGIELDAIVSRAMRKNPADRYQSAVELAGEIRSCLAADHSLRRPRPRAFKAAGILALAAILAAAAWLILRSIRHAPNEEDLRVEPLTSLPDDEYRPSFSPDGSRVVFCWGYGFNVSSLWVKQVDGNSLTRLTTKGNDEFPAWSPDGKWIAFVQAPKDVMLMPSLGGLERKIAETRTYYLSWLPDSSSVLVATLRPNTYDIFDVDAVSIESGKRTRLTTPRDEFYGYQPLSPSPDGRWFGFTHRPGPGKEADIYIRPFSGGPARQITSMGRHLDGWTWTPDSREIVFSANPYGYYSLWRVSIDGGKPPTQLKIGGADNLSVPFMVPVPAPRTSAAGRLLGFEIWERRMNLHQLRIEPSKDGQKMRVLGPPETILQSSAQEHSPDFAPDGQRVVFISNRTGYQEVWLASGPAWDALPLTSFGRDNLYPYSPRWSHDGTRVALEVERGEMVPAFADPGQETSQIVVLGVNGGASQELINSSLNVRPSWSHDDRWIYFGSRRSGAWQLWRAPAAGSAGKDAAVQVTKAGGFEALESLDGKYLFYKKSSSDLDLWRMPITAAGPLEREAARFQTGKVPAGWWAVGGQGIFFADILADARHGVPENEFKPIYFVDFRTKTQTRLAAIDGRGYFWLADFTVSRDGRRLVYSQIDYHNFDLRMVRNFR